MSVSMTAMDGPRVCQRWSAVFELDTALRTDAAHVRGEGLQGYREEQSWHPGREYAGNHGDKRGDINQDMNQPGVGDMDSGHCDTLVTDRHALVFTVVDDHGVNVTFSHSGSHGDTIGGMLPDMITRALYCCDELSAQPSNLTPKDAPLGSARHSNAVTENLHEHSPKRDAYTKKAFTFHRPWESQEGTYTGDKPHPCNILNTTSTLPDALTVNERIITLDRPHVCAICSMAFKHLSGLKRHEHIHTGHRPYVCKLCKKTFTRSEGLRTHELIHTGEKPFECNVCKKTFNRMTNLKTHVRTHTGEKPFECIVCKKAFISSDKLKQHERIHTGERPYACEVCKKTFGRSAHLKAHERTHTGEKPFVCDVCKKAFSTSSYLKKHKRVHTGEKPYVCNVCKKTFITFSFLKRHERIHTGA